MSYLEKISSPKDIKNMSLEELKELSKEIREVIIDTVSKNGGHLAPNLGVVELTIALHKVLNCPADKLVWDVSHQTYTHKLLTGRYDKFDTIRQYEGLSGYTSIEESPYDAFGAGHSSTSLSAALGMAIRADLMEENNSVVAVIGDGALTSGMAWEALNHIGHIQKKMVVVINDNQMSISQNVGAMAQYLNLLRTDRNYTQAKENIRKLLEDIPVIGSGLKSTVSKVKNSLKYLLVKGLIFEELGFTYMGPIDGHDIDSIQTHLKQALSINKPVIIHTITKKGYGYKPAVSSPEVYHGVSPFFVDTGKVKHLKPKSFSNVFGESVTKLAENDKKIVAITAAMCSGVGLDSFKRTFPDRFFDTGITEQHATTLAAGMAAAGLKPVFAVYSTFLQRAYDQIIHDIALQKLPVIFALDRAGLVGADGATHHGVFDLSYLRSIPNLTVMAPSNGEELGNMLEFAFELNKPCAIRYPRGAANLISKSTENELILGKADILVKGSQVVLWAIGRMTATAIEVAEKLRQHHINPTVVDARFLKPFDESLLKSLSKKNALVVSLEDNIISGGMGELMSNILQDNKIYTDIIKFGIPDRFVKHGNVNQLDHELGIDSDSIVEKILVKLTNLHIVGEENTFRQITGKK
ncbi:MAG: 1-deoxy-D-xylulose-5-phosphate synthase [Clostridia bacterium]